MTSKISYWLVATTICGITSLPISEAFADKGIETFGCQGCGRSSGQSNNNAAAAAAIGLGVGLLLQGLASSPSSPPPVKAPSPQGASLVQWWRKIRCLA